MSSIENKLAGLSTALIELFRKQVAAGKTLDASPAPRRSPRVCNTGAGRRGEIFFGERRRAVRVMVGADILFAGLLMAISGFYHSKF